MSVSSIQDPDVKENKFAECPRWIARRSTFESANKRGSADHRGVTLP